MAQLFDISNGEVVLTPEGLLVPAFKALWDRDKDKHKHNALNEIKYVVFLKDPMRSPYKDIEESKKEGMIREDIFGKKSKWKPDELVLEAMRDYEELRITTTLRLLRSAKSATERLAAYFEDVDLKQVDQYGKPLYSAKELASNLGSVGNIIKSLMTLEEAARRELTENSRIKGGSDINYFEDPDNY